jgi:SPP1 gp7 family putative phage head morphogenesis protein
MNQVNEELSNLALKQNKAFENAMPKVYEEQSLIENGVLGDKFGLYSTVDKEAAKRVVDELWCSDGKGLSGRIWKNKDYLMQSLEQSLFDFVSMGQPTAQLTQDLISAQMGRPFSELSNILDKDFREAYNNARRLVRTETARVQNRATQDRYKDAGFTKYRIVAEPDCCEVCDDLSKQVFDIDDLVIPAHPNCRCAMAAITESLI